MLTIVNFTHPLTDAQKGQIEELTGQAIERVLDKQAQFDPAHSFVDQVRCMVSAVSLSESEWQTLSLLVNPPSLSPIACLLLAELHGRMGHFPTIIRLRPKVDSNPVVYEVAELFSL